MLRLHPSGNDQNWGAMHWEMQVVQFACFVP